MKLNGLFALLAIFFLLIISGGIWLWRYTYVESPEPAELNIARDDSSYKYKIDKNWLEKISSLKQTDSDLPTNLMFIEIDNSPIINGATKYFELVLSDRSFYPISCISRVARDFGVELTVVKQAQNLFIHLNADNRAVVQNIVNGLKKYNIYSSIKEY